MSLSTFKESRWGVRGAMSESKKWSKGRVKMAKNSFVEKQKKNFPKWMFKCEFDVVGVIGWREDVFLQLKDEAGNVLPAIFNMKLFEVIQKP